MIVIVYYIVLAVAFDILDLHVAVSPYPCETMLAEQWLTLADQVHTDREMELDCGLNYYFHHLTRYSVNQLDDEATAFDSTATATTDDDLNEQIAAGGADDARTRASLNLQCYLH